MGKAVVSNLYVDATARRVIGFSVLCLLSLVLPLAARAATSGFSGTLNLCRGDVFNYYESHGSSYTYTLKSNADSTSAMKMRSARRRARGSAIR